MEPKMYAFQWFELQEWLVKIKPERLNDKLVDLTIFNGVLFEDEEREEFETIRQQEELEMIRQRELDDEEEG